MPKINPYYDPAKLGLELYSLDERNMGYEYNTLCFWATNTGQIFTAQDAGCSCPVPFIGCSGETQKDVLQGLERVGTVEQAERIFDSWNNDIYKQSGRCSQSDKNELLAWVKARLTS